MIYRLWIFFWMKKNLNKGDSAISMVTRQQREEGLAMSTAPASNKQQL